MRGPVASFVEKAIAQDFARRHSRRDRVFVVWVTEIETTERPAGAYMNGKPTAEGQS